MATRTYDIWVLNEQGNRVRQAVVETVPDEQVLAEQNTADLQTRAVAAVAANITYLGLASPTNAQTAVQVRALTRECTALIRLLLGVLDSTDGT